MDYKFVATQPIVDLNMSWYRFGCTAGVRPIEDESVCGCPCEKWLKWRAPVKTLSRWAQT
ncbi:hypothetical protein N7453_009695 [Penicillium expansum]|nr:hypothetical protein N7453_009695 [Penicillium expansum]